MGPASSNDTPPTSFRIIHDDKVSSKAFSFLFSPVTFHPSIVIVQAFVPCIGITTTRLRTFRLRTFRLRLYDTSSTDISSTDISSTDISSTSLRHFVYRHFVYRHFVYYDFRC